MKKKILLLFCGGTIVMHRNRQGALVPYGKEEALCSLLDLEPKIHELADLELIFIANIDSSDIQPNLWDAMARTIEKNYDDFDGFVITHGTDTMAYSASALSFALNNLGKPVVFTGAMIPGNQIESDARRNLVNAVRVASLDIAAVLVVFGTKIILGSRASKVSHSELEAFASINIPSVGRVGVKLRFFSQLPARHSAPLNLKPGFDAKIAVISLVPGMPKMVFQELLEGDVHAVVLIAYGSGNIPEDYLPFLEEAKLKELPIVIRSQCLEGSTSMRDYASGLQALDYCVIEVKDMSLESTITKLMWTLKQGVDYDEIESLMKKNIAGEITE